MPEAVKSAHRALQIVGLFSEETRPWSFQEMTDYLGYPRASMHGLLETLVADRWLAKDSSTKRYSLGIKAFEAGAAYQRINTLETLARRVMDRIRSDTGETVQLAVLDGLEAVYVAKAVGSRLLRLDSEVGSRLPAHATGVGKVLLSCLPERELHERLEGVELERLTERTITTHAGLMDELASIRERGFATDNEECTLGARCVAVPVRRVDGSCAAAMSISVPTAQHTAELRQRLARDLRRGAEELSHQLVSSHM